MLMLALVLTQIKIWKAHSLRVLAINGLGGFILAIGAMFGVIGPAKNVELLPWVILNTTWCTISIFNFIREWKKKGLPSSATLPVSAVRVRNHLNQPVCEHDEASWQTIERDDGQWEWESNCLLCGIQTWHMKKGWSKTKDDEGNLIHVQQWHAKAMKNK